MYVCQPCKYFKINMFWVVARQFIVRYSGTILYLLKKTHSKRFDLFYIQELIIQAIKKHKWEYNTIQFIDLQYNVGKNIVKMYFMICLVDGQCVCSECVDAL